MLHSRSHSADRRDGLADPSANGPSGSRLAPEDTTNYEHRHFVNLAAAAFLLLIAIAIVWTIRAMEDYEKLQRCLNSGRRDCVAITAPTPAVLRPTHR